MKSSQPQRQLPAERRQDDKGGTQLTDAEGLHTSCRLPSSCGLASAAYDKKVLGGRLNAYKPTSGKTSASERASAVPRYAASLMRS
jgi:hypothetical protein